MGVGVVVWGDPVVCTSETLEERGKNICEGQGQSGNFFALRKC